MTTWPGRPGDSVWPAGSTGLCAVIGDPVRHSLSPHLHNAAFSAEGLDWVFVACPVAAGSVREALAGAWALGLAGLSVTMPHKSEVARLVASLSRPAARLGAVNTVVRRPHGFEGHNTDGEGLVATLREDLGFDAVGRSAMVLGAGGAGRAVALALAGAGVADLVIVNRTPGRADEVAAIVGPPARPGDQECADGADLVVNATPVGMAGVGSGPPVEASRLGPGQLVVDLVYHPAETPLVRAALARGARAVNGLGVLVHQAASAFTLWTGVPAPVDAMRAAAGAALGAAPQDPLPAEPADGSAP